MAKRDYNGLQVLFQEKEFDAILNFVCGLILLPINENRFEQFSNVESLFSMLNYFEHC